MRSSNFESFDAFFCNSIIMDMWLKNFDWFYAE